MFNSRWFFPVVLFTACLAAYFNSFTNNFLFDDNSILFGQGGMLNRSFFGIFSQNQGIFYRPMGHIPLWVLSRFLGDNFVGYHVANFILFFLIVFLLYLIIRNITNDNSLAFLAALLYGVHPINGFIANYVTASVIAVFVLFMQASFLCYMSFFDKGRRSDYVLGFILFVYACFSHEMAVVFPVFLIAYLFFIKEYSWLQILKALYPFILFLGIWFIFRSHGLILHQDLTHSPLSMANAAAYFSTWVSLVGWWLSKLFLPQNILYMWNSPFAATHLLIDAGYFLIALGLGAYAFYRWRKGWKPFFLAVFIIGILPTLYACFVYFPSMMPFIEPHWLYFTETGFFVLGGWCLQAVIRKNAPFGILLTVCIVFVLMSLCWVHNSKWKTQGTYSRYWLSLNADNLIPYCGLGRSLMDRGDYAGAIKVYSQGTQRLDQMSASIAADMGHSFDMLGEDHDALSYLIMAIQGNISYAMAYQYLGVYYSKRGNLKLAQKAFQVAISLDPHISSTYLRKLY